MHAAGTLRSNQRHIVPYLVEYILAVNIYPLVRRVEQVTQHTHGTARLLVYHARHILCLLCPCQRIRPALYQYLQLVVQLTRTLALGHGTHYNPHIVGLHALYDLLQPCTLLLVLDLGRYVNLVLERYQYQETPRKAQLASQPRPLRAYRFLHYLHQHLLALLQHRGNLTVLGRVRQYLHLACRRQVLLVRQNALQILRIRLELGTQIQVVQERILLVPDVYEARVQSRHQLAYLCQIYVAHLEARLLALFLVFHQFLILGQSDRNLLGLYIQKKFAVHLILIPSYKNPAAIPY